MEQQWYVQSADGSVFGPMSSTQLVGAARSGQIREDELISRSCLGPWKPANRVHGLFDGVGATAPLPVAVPIAERVGLLSHSTVRAAALIAGLLVIVTIAIAADRLFNRPDANPQPEIVTAAKVITEEKPAAPPPVAQASTVATLPDRDAGEFVPVSSSVAESTQDVIARVLKSVVRVQTDQGHGSGFLTENSTTVVTNFHVVEGAKLASVTFNDGQKMPVAGFIAAYPELDLAVLQLQSGRTDLPLLSIHLAPVTKGDEVFAFGSPKGLDSSVSNGIVSSLRTGADLASATGDNARLTAACSLVQTTAPISPGNSGGPLTDRLGRLVGVNTLSANPLLGTQNLNIAVAAPMVIVALNGRHEARSLEKLPISEYRKSQVARDAEIDRAQTEFEASQRQSMARAEAQRELDRLNLQIITLKNLASSEGGQLARLQQNLGNLKQEGAALYAAGLQANQNALVVEAQIAQVAQQLRQAEATVGYDRIAVQSLIPQLQTRLAELQIHYAQHLKDGRDIDSIYQTAKQQAVELSSQVEEKQTRIYQLERELQSAEAQYKRLSQSR